jgi:nucleoprotein TPR
MRDSAIAEAAEAKSQQKAQPSDTAMDDGTEDGQIDERPKNTLSDDEKKALEARIIAAEAMAKERDDKAKEIEATMDATLKARSEKMKAALNKKLVESKETMKAQLEADFKLKLEQEKQIWLAENKPTAESTAAIPSQPATKSEEASAPAHPATPSKAAAVVDGTNLNDEQVRHLLSTNPTVKSILANNLKKKLDVEAQKIKDEQAKTLAEKVAEVEKKAEAAMTEAQQKAEHAQAQAVIMAEKKTSLKLNMTENRFKMANAKIVVVETAARETPEKPVSEVWEVAKNAKPPPAPVAAPAAPTAPVAPTAPAAAVVPAAPIAPISTSAPPAAVAADSPAATQPAETAIANAPVAQFNGTPAGNENAEVKAEAVKSGIPQARPQTPSMQQPNNGASGLPVSNIPSVSHPTKNVCSILLTSIRHHKLETSPVYHKCVAGVLFEGPGVVSPIKHVVVVQVEDEVMLEVKEVA